MGENIDPTWIAWASRTDAERGWKGPLEAIRSHYARLVDYELVTREAAAGAVGVATIGDAEPACRWGHFSADDDYAIATAYVPTGWDRLTGSVPLPDAPLTLARRLRERPEAASLKLNAPFAAAVLDKRSRRLTVMNDALGAARVYVAERDGVTAWSNRPGALILFLGIDARADLRSWLVLAAASWFLADTAPVEGMRRLPAASVVEAERELLAEHKSDALKEWVRPAGDLAGLAGEAIDHARAQAESAEALWPGRASVDLSGGRDSRLAAAAVLAAGIPAEFRTSDATPGEADVARALIAAAPGEHPHRITKTEAGSATPSTGLLERAANLHLVHDGVRHPQKLRGKWTLPRPRPVGATLSGHGGEIAHGFFYKDKAQLRKLSRRRSRLPARVMRFFRKDHEAALPEAYEEAERHVEATLDEGRRLGLDGPVLLDWFYLVDRFAHRSGLATDSERISVFATPGFVRASFALDPSDRTTDRLHLELTGRLVPEWRDIPYFEAPKSRSPMIRRERLWEIERDAGVVEEILAGGGPWTEIYDERKAKEAWAELRLGNGPAKAESLFEGIVYRHAFDEHLRALSSQAVASRPR